MTRIDDITQMKDPSKEKPHLIVSQEDLKKALQMLEECGDRMAKHYADGVPVCLFSALELLKKMYEEGMKHKLYVNPALTAYFKK